MNENKMNYHNYQMQINDLKKNYGNQEQIPRHEHTKEEMNYTPPMNFQISDREEKKYNQEEYRKILDQQRLETFNRIGNNEGLVNQDKQIGVNQCKGKVMQYDERKENEFLKEKERQKKMEYNQYLKQQIEERKQKKEIEKRKQKEEEEMYEQKYQEMNKLELPVNIKKHNAYNQMLTTEEQIRLQQQQQQQFNQQSQPQQLQQSEYQPQLIMQQNNTDRMAIQPQQQYQYDLNNQANNYTIQERNYPIPLQQSLYDNPKLYNTQSPPRMMSPKFPDPHNPQPYDQYQPNPYTQFPNSTFNSNSQSHPLKSLNYTPMPNYPMNMTTQPIQPMNPNYFVPNAQQPMLSYDHLNDLFQKFMANQMTLISEYENKIDYMSSNALNNDYIQTLLSERNSTMDKIKSDQERIRSCIGYYPMQHEYNSKISNLLNVILEKKIDKMQSMTANKTSRVQSAKPSNYNNAYQNNSKNETDFINSNHNRIDESLPIQSKEFNIPKQTKQPLITSQVYRDAMKCNYRSKYEDLKQSIMNFDNVSHQLRESLAGNSKFVKPTENNNNNVPNSNSQNLFQTWKSEWKQDLNDKNMSKLESIQEEMNNNQQGQLYNISQSKILMTKSSCTLTERSYNGDQNEPLQEIMNKDNNVSHQTEVFKSISKKNENICNPNFYVDDEEKSIVKVSNNKGILSSVCSIPKGSVKIEEKIQSDEEEYDNNEFENEKVIAKLNVKTENVCLDDYKDLHESQKFQTQLNYFEDSYIDHSNVNKSNQQKEHVIQQSTNKTLQRPQSPKLKEKQSINQSNNNRRPDDKNNSQKASIGLRSNMSSNIINDSYGDNIINDLNKYRQMALEESSIQKSFMKLLYDQLVMIIKENKHEEYKEEIKDVIHLIVDFVLYGEKNDSELFDLFCEYDILKEFVYLSKESKCRDVNLEILNDIAMLILNLKNNQSLYYLFSNNYINQIISNDYDKYDDDFISYYVNFLKSLSLKLDITTIQFFFHKQINSFPLMESAMKIYNHPDPMIRNVVRNIFLNITKLRYEPFYDYLCCLPSVIYFTLIACHLRDITIALEKMENLDKFKSMQEDIIDEVIYIQDIFSLRILKINYILTNTLMYYYVMPLLLGTLLSTTSMQITISLALYILIVLFYYIKDENFVNTLFYVIFSPTISKGVFKFIQEYPLDPKNYFFDYYKQKNQTSDSFATYIEEHFSAAFIQSIVYMNNSPFSKIKEIVKKYEDLQDLNPNYNPNSPNFLETITKNVLDKMNASEFSISSAYHKRLSISTGVNCGMSTKDWRYCFMSKMKGMFDKVSSNKIHKLIPNKIRLTINSFFKTKGDNLLLLVNLLLYVVLHHDNISKALLNYMKFSPLTKDSNIMMKMHSQRNLNNDNNNINDDKYSHSINKTKSTSLYSSAKIKKYEKTKVSLSDFVMNKEVKDILLFSINDINAIFTKEEVGHDNELVDSLLNLINTESYFRKITIRLVIENIIKITKDNLSQKARTYLRHQFKGIINKIIESSKFNDVNENKLFHIFELTWVEYTKQLPIADVITNSYLIAPYSFYDENDVFLPVFNIVDEDNSKMIFEIDLMLFMVLNDYISSMSKNKKQQHLLLKYKYPFNQNDLEIDREYNTKGLVTELYPCIIKNKCVSELRESLMAIMNNKIYFGLEAPNDRIVIKSKYSLSQVELQVDRAEPRMLSLFCLSSKDKFIEKNCLFKDVDTTIRVKRSLEDHIKTAQYKESNLFVEYFTYLSQEYFSK